MMEYQGYIAKVELDEDGDVFHGEVINLRDVITFEGKSVSELRKAMRESVEDYLAFCEERKEEPEKPFSGRLLVRIDPALHREIYVRSREEDKSLNSWIAEKLGEAVEGGGQSLKFREARRKVGLRIAKSNARVGGRLPGVLRGAKRGAREAVFRPPPGPDRASAPSGDLCSLKGRGQEFEQLDCGEARRSS